MPFFGTITPSPCVIRQRHSNVLYEASSTLIRAGWQNLHDAQNLYVFLKHGADTAVFASQCPEAVKEAIQKDGERPRIPAIGTNADQQGDEFIILFQCSEDPKPAEGKHSSIALFDGL